MPTKLSSADARALARKVLAWAKTREGKRVLKQTQEAVKKTNELLDKLRKVPDSVMYQPFGPADGSGDWKKCSHNKVKKG